jgi:hypothetical protein
MSANGDIERGLAHAKPNLGFELLAVVFNQVNHGNRGFAHMSSDANDILELGLTGSIEDTVSSQGSKTLSFIPWWAALLGGGTIITATHYTNLNRLGCLSSGNTIRINGG